MFEYLSRFGYIHNLREDSAVDAEETKEGVREFQENANLIPNGRLNRRTIAAMNMPRCGNRDERIYESDEIDASQKPQTRSNPHALVRRKRFDLQGPRWRKRVLTYRIAKFAASSLKPKTLQKEIDLAFKYWEREANLTFRKVWDGKADIEISFFTALGLGHSTDKQAVMYLMYQGFRNKLQLHADDIFAIQALYGPKIQPSTNPKLANEVYKQTSPFTVKLDGMVSGPKENLPDLCTDPKIDAISTLADGHIYVFQGEYYFRMKMGQPYSREQYPRRINESFAGLPSSLDTVLTVSSGKTYFFKGRLYWRSTGTRMDKGYPKKIKTNFLGVPNHLDASTVWSWNNMVYFFKNNRYWRYSFEHPRKLVETGIISKQRVSNGKIKVIKQNASGYPRRIATNWPGIPEFGIEDAFLAPNNRTYFFKEGEYWQFHDPDSDQEAASYPRPSTSWWFGCNDISLDTRRTRHHRNRKLHI
ncbi:Matrix metalloproteinase-19 [Orchesella cincta]|uniref:Matrix metalloproteinase-19 n=1 Tax=Orchesella cincta TaxID=48709 RepID=A0A1D2MU61_ORCCI|nr:Matrix metalloproteinase-19 [Orchesella cincta]